MVPSVRSVDSALFGSIGVAARQALDDLAGALPFLRDIAGAAHEDADRSHGVIGHGEDPVAVKRMHPCQRGQAVNSGTALELGVIIDGERLAGVVIVRLSRSSQSDLALPIPT